MATERRWTITVCGYGSVCEPVCGEPCPGTTEVEVMPVSVLREWIAEPRGFTGHEEYALGYVDALDALAVLIEQGAPDHTETKKGTT